jgi:LysM repeat protein
MIRKNFMNGLLAIAGVGTLLVGYNAFLNSNSDSGSNATTKLSSYLGLNQGKNEGADQAQQTVTVTPETAKPEVKVTDSTMTPDTAAVTTPAVTPSTTATVPAMTVAAGARAATSYTVKSGDTYGCIAEKYYGSFEHFQEVMTANPVNDVGFGEYSLFEGAVLSLPAMSASEVKPASTICQ